MLFTQRAVLRYLMEGDDPRGGGGLPRRPEPSANDIIAGSDIVTLELEDGEMVVCYFPDTFPLGNKKGWAAILIHKAEYDAGSDYTFWVTGYNARASGTDRFYALPEHLEEEAEETAIHCIDDMVNFNDEEEDDSGSKEDVPKYNTDVETWEVVKCKHGDGDEDFDYYFAGTLEVDGRLYAVFIEKMSFDSRNPEGCFWHARGFNNKRKGDARFSKLDDEDEVVEDAVSTWLDGLIEAIRRIMT